MSAPPPGNASQQAPTMPQEIVDPLGLNFLTHNLIQNFLPKTGRNVEHNIEEDKKLISAVRQRDLLYVRSSLPVATYHEKVRRLWEEVADEMGWTVPEVRRKWSHIRNSYSRHLRNEMYGMRTSTGRMVSKWYLADEMEFLRTYMATDTRSNASAPKAYSRKGIRMSRDSPDLQGYLLCASSQMTSENTSIVGDTASNDDSSDNSIENTSYFTFFRGIHEDYQQLSPRNKRLFKQKCLGILYELIDSEASEEHFANPYSQPPLIPEALVKTENAEDRVEVITDEVDDSI